MDLTLTCDASDDHKDLANTHFNNKRLRALKAPTDLETWETIEQTVQEQCADANFEPTLQHCIDSSLDRGEVQRCIDAVVERDSSILFNVFSMH